MAGGDARYTLDRGVSLYKTIAMGRPRISAAMVNGRITAEQMEWLTERAEELGGNLSAALRQAITDARFLEFARENFKQFREANPEFEGFGYDDEGSTWVFDFILRGPRGSESDDLELRRQEADEQ